MKDKERETEVVMEEGEVVMEVKDKERETEVVMEEGEVVTEVKQVIVAEVEVGGSLLSRWRWRMCQGSRWGDMEVFSDVGKGKSGMLGKGKGKHLK